MDEEKVWLGVCKQGSGQPKQFHCRPFKESRDGLLRWAAPRQQGARRGEIAGKHTTLFVRGSQELKNAECVRTKMMCDVCCADEESKEKCCDRQLVERLYTERVEQCADRFTPTVCPLTSTVSVVM